MGAMDKNLKIPLIALCLSILGICVWGIIIFFINQMGIGLTYKGFTSIIILETMAFFISYFVVRRYKDNKSSLELMDMNMNKRDIVYIFIGLFLGLVMFVAYKAILFIMKVEIYKGNGFKFYTTKEVIISVVTAFIIAIFSAVCEEVLCRGVILKYLTKFNGETFALIISTIIFTLLHAFQYQNFMQMCEMLILGAALGYCYTLTKSLYFPIALHFAWNFYNALTAVNGIGLFIFTINNRLSSDYCSYIIMVAQSVIEITVAIILICIDIKRKQYIEQ